LDDEVAAIGDPGETLGKKEEAYQGGKRKKKERKLACQLGRNFPMDDGRPSQKPLSGRTVRIS